MELQELIEKEREHRAKASEHYKENQSHLALNELGKGTRLRVWIEVKEGSREIMKKCILLNHKQLKGIVVGNQSTNRRYRLNKYNGDREVDKANANAALRAIAERQLPTRGFKEMQARISFYR